MNKRTVALTEEQVQEIIRLMRKGTSFFRPNEKIATALLLQANVGLRISDILKLRLCDIIPDGDRYRFEIVEQKTGKARRFTVSFEIRQFLENYCLRNHVPEDRVIFNITERAVAKYLKKVVDYIGYENIGTHSFRKFYATTVYNKSNYNIRVTQLLLQHASSATTERYLGVSKEVEEILRKPFLLM